MPARVLVVGCHLGLAEHMDAGLIRGFRQIGCQVGTFDYRASNFLPGILRRVVPSHLRHRLSPRRLPAVERADTGVSNRRFLVKIRRFRPDVLVALQAERLSGESIAAARRHGLVAMNWIGDEPWRFLPEDIIPAYDLWAVFDRTLGGWLLEHGARRVEHLPVACDPTLHHPVPLSPHERRRWASRVCFVGGHTEPRENVLESVADLGLSIWGPGWRQARSPRIRECIRASRMLSRAEWLKAFAAADLVLNIHSQGQEGLNLRVWEALGCEACLVSNYMADFDRFLNGLVVTFGDAGELRQRCQELLADPERRTAMARRARQHVLRAHTYAHRAETFLRWAQMCRGAR